jgi:hypothetical protein
MARTWLFVFAVKGSWARVVGRRRANGRATMMTSKTRLRDSGRMEME